MTLIFIGLLISIGLEGYHISQSILGKRLTAKTNPYLVIADLIYTITMIFCLFDSNHRLVFVGGTCLLIMAIKFIVPKSARNTYDLIDSIVCSLLLFYAVYAIFK